MSKPPVLNGFLSRQSQIKKIGEKTIPTATGGESKGMARTRTKRRASSPAENKCPTALKLQKTSTVKQECQGDKGKEELHPDRSDKTSNEQTLKQNEEELRKKEQELQEKEKEIEELKREKEKAQHELQQQAQENKTLTARIEELEEEIERLNAEIKKLKEESEKHKEENEELRKREQELQGKEKEIEELKRKEKDAQHKLQQQAQENKRLTTRIEELEEKFERLKAEIIKLKEQLENLKEQLEKQEEQLEKQKEQLEEQKEQLEKIKENQHYLLLAAMCDQLQKNFYQIVFYPHDFSNEKQSYKEKDIENNINKGRYGLTIEEKKRQARERWSDLKKQLGWVSDDHVMGIKKLKYDRNLTAHPKITKDMKKSLEDGAKALNHERKLDEPTFGIVQNLIDMWLKTEDLVQEQEEKKNKEQTA